MKSSKDEPKHPTTIRPTLRRDLPALKAMIDANGLFPSEMLDDMVSSFFTGGAGAEQWLTVDDGGPVAVAYYVPERMTQGTGTCC